MSTSQKTKGSSGSRPEAVGAFAVGLVFAGGLALSGMTLPSKVVGFFDFHEGLASWDPSLGFVMVGGVLVYLAAYLWLRRRGKPLFANDFARPKTIIDRRLILGAALFGLGWGLVGYCPGPALTSLGSGSTQAVIVVGAMALGMLLFRFFDGRRHAGKSGPAA